MQCLGFLFYFSVTYLMAKHYSKNMDESDFIISTEKSVTLDDGM